MEWKAVVFVGSDSSRKQTHQ